MGTRVCTETRSSNQCRVGGELGSFWPVPSKAFARATADLAQEHGGVCPVDAQTVKAMTGYEVRRRVGRGRYMMVQTREE
jgi:hypothetical protein